MAHKTFSKQLDGRRGTSNAVLDDIRSQVGGNFNVAAAGASALLYTVPANRAFHLTTVIAAQSTMALSGTLTIRQSSAGVVPNNSVLLNIAFSRSGVIADKNYVATRIQGCVVIASTTTAKYVRMLATTSRMFCRIGGLLRKRTNVDTTN